MQRVAALAKETPASANAMSLSPLQNRGAGSLQRKCACGGTPGPTGECEACKKKRQLGLQTKLKINEPGDAYEHEADRVAQTMVGSFSRPAEPKSKAGSELQAPSDGDLTKGGERLPQHVAEFFETRFGRDFSAVRVHTGDTAMRYNDAVNAYAFTYGSHIWLGPGLLPQPSHVLAHELAHVVQQTQPVPVDSATNQPDLSPSRQGVQRFAPYWMPEEYTAVGTDSHAFILPKIGKKNKIFTEAPVPNADKESEGFDKKGIADLYKASTTVGIFFAEVKLPKKLSSNRELKYKGERYEHIIESAPQADEKRHSVMRSGSGPTEILVGDLKPSHGTIEASEGPEQVKGYLKGFEIAHREVNEMDVGLGGFEQTDAKWKPLTTGIIELEVPKEFKEPIAAGQKAQPLKLIHNGTRVEVRRRVMGKVYVRPDPGGGGIWNYIWAPTTRLTAADLPESVTGLGAEITAKIIRPLLVSPVTTAAKAKPARPAANLTSSAVRIQTRGREQAAEEVRDPFDKAAFETWKADHRRLTGEEKQLEKTPPFKEAEFKSLVVEDRQAAAKSGFYNLPNPAVTKEEEKASKTLDKIRFWTGASSAIFGRLRYWFGGAFVKVVNAYHAIRARFHKSLEGKTARKSGGLLGTIVKIAFNILKIAGRILVERTAQHLIDSLKTGVAQKLKSLIPEDKFEEFEAKVKEIEEIAANLERQAVEAVEALVERTIGPYEGYIETIHEWADRIGQAADVINKVRWGARVIACLSPPGWGCLWILAESVIEKFASWVIDRCWFRREIAPLVTRVDFIATLPAKLAAFIVDQIKSLLPEKLQDVFAKIDTSKVSTNFQSHEICSEEDRDTLPRDRFLWEKLALAELRKEIGEEKWAAWEQLGKLYGASRVLPLLTEEEIVQLKKELVKASLPALKEAAELHGVFTPSNKVTNLTTFLEEAEQVKQQMYGGGGPGGEGGGEVGISVGPSRKPVEGSGRPSSGWKISTPLTRGQFQGQIIKVDLAKSINGVVVTLENVEVAIKSRVFLPNKSNPDKVVFYLEVTKEVTHNFKEKYGSETLKRIGFAWHRYKQGDKLPPYTLQLKGGKAE